MIHWISFKLPRFVNDVWRTVCGLPHTAGLQFRVFAREDVTCPVCRKKMGWDR